MIVRKNLPCHLISSPYDSKICVELITLLSRNFFFIFLAQVTVDNFAWTTILRFCQIFDRCTTSFVLGRNLRLFGRLSSFWAHHFSSKINVIDIIVFLQIKILVEQKCKYTTLIISSLSDNVLKVLLYTRQSQLLRISDFHQAKISITFYNMCWPSIWKECCIWEYKGTTLESFLVGCHQMFHQPCKTPHPNTVILLYQFLNWVHNCCFLILHNLFMMQPTCEAVARKATIGPMPLHKLIALGFLSRRHWWALIVFRPSLHILNSILA